MKINDESNAAVDKFLCEVAQHGFKGIKSLTVEAARKTLSIEIQNISGESLLKFNLPLHGPIYVGYIGACGTPLLLNCSWLLKRVASLIEELKGGKDKN